jgi:hypothetical protein
MCRGRRARSGRTRWLRPLDNLGPRQARRCRTDAFRSAGKWLAGAGENLAGPRRGRQGFRGRRHGTAWRARTAGGRLHRRGWRPWNLWRRGTRNRSGRHGRRLLCTPNRAPCRRSRRRGVLSRGLRWRGGRLRSCAGERRTDRKRGARKRLLGRGFYRLHRRGRRYFSHCLAGRRSGRGRLCFYGGRGTGGVEILLDEVLGGFVRVFPRGARFGRLSEVLPQFDCDVLVYRAGVGLLFTHAELGKAVQYFVCLHFELSGQLVNSNLLHRMVQLIVLRVDTQRPPMDATYPSCLPVSSCSRGLEPEVSMLADSTRSDSASSSTEPGSKRSSLDSES